MYTGVRRSVVASAVVVSLFAAACGGDDPPDRADRETSPPASSGSPSSPAPTPSASPRPTPPARPGPIAVRDQPLVSVPVPTALAGTPDGRMLVTSQSGQLRVVAGGRLVARPVLDLSGRLCSDVERGLLGVAVDPRFASTSFIYLYYTFRRSGGCARNSSSSPVNRVSRFVLSADNRVAPASERVLLDNMPSPNGNHNGGDLAFGPDGLLYVTIGDGGCDYAGNSGCAGSNDASRDRNVLTGKVLRITGDGAIPPSNPFRGAGTARCNVIGRDPGGRVCQETFAWGLRNPFRLAFDPTAEGARFFLNDVGQNVWEEIDEGRAGVDYGWPVREGMCANGSTSSCGPPPAGMTNPVFAYGRQDGCTTISAAAFVPDAAWPPGYAGSYLFGDFGCGRIFRLAGGRRVEVARAPGIVAMAFLDLGNGLALYYTSYTDGGTVHRVTVTPR